MSLKTRTETRQVGPLTLRATFAPESVNVEKRTVDVTWTTGAKVLRSSWLNGNYYEELSLDPAHVRLDRLNNGAPFLANHNSYDVARTLGVVIPGSAKLSGSKGTAKVRFAKAEDDPEADKVFRKIADGIIQNVSVGYRTYKVEKSEGVDNKIPTVRAVDWEPYEVSAVAMGADDGAGFRSADREQTHELQIITNEVTDRDLPEKAGQMDPEELKKQEAERQAEIAKRAAEEAEKALKVERERNTGILHAVRAAKLEGEIAEKLIADPKMTLDSARAFVLNELAKRDMENPTDNKVRVTAVEGQDERDKWVRGVSAAMFESAGSKCDVLRAHERASRGELKGALAREFKDIALDGAQFRGMRISDIARAVVERSGKSSKNLYGEQLLDAAIRAATGDFAILFENVMNKSMRASYAVQADTWREWVGVETVKDFRETNRYMNGAFSGAIPVVPEGAEFTTTSIPDGSKLTLATETRGEMITLTRQALINDDMGALVDLAARFGRKAGQSLEIIAYQQLALNTGLGPDMSDSQPFFHSNRANVSTGAALSVAAIDADRLKFRAQTFGQDFLDLRPSILLIPVGLESAARIINEDAYDHTTGSNNNVPNPVRGLFRKIVSSPRLSASTTRRYLFEDSLSAFKMVFLEGSGEGPTLQSEEGFTVDGTRWKARMDFKFNTFDGKTAVTNAGT